MSTTDPQCQEFSFEDKILNAIPKCWGFIDSPASTPCPYVAVIRDKAGWYWCQKHRKDIPTASIFDEVDEYITVTFIRERIRQIMDSPQREKLQEVHSQPEMEIRNAKQDSWQASRLKARHFIEERVGKLRREANKLEELLKALPLELPHDADEALWTILTTRY